MQIQCSSLHSLHILSTLMRNFPFRKLCYPGWIHLSWLVLIFTESVKSWVTPACSIYGACAGVMSDIKYHSSFLHCQQRLAFVGLPGAFPWGAEKALEGSRSSPHLSHRRKTVDSRSCVEAHSGYVLHLYNYSTHCNYAPRQRERGLVATQLCVDPCPPHPTLLFYRIGRVWISCWGMLVWEISVKMDTS